LTAGVAMDESGLLDEGARGELLHLARHTLDEYLTYKRMPSYRPERAKLKSRQGAFVSLHRGSTLRGCIGQIVPDRELHRIVADCAVSAATEDTRFPPITAVELSSLTIEISVLTPPRRVTDPSEIEVGRHGIIVSRGYRRGLLLPQVATQYGWDREAFLSQTCRKAGLPESAWKEPDTVVESFEAQVFSEAQPGAS